MAVSSKGKMRLTKADFVEKLLGIGACLVFLVSVASPFYEFRSTVWLRALSTPPINHVWTYKLRMEDSPDVGPAAEYWFDECWSGPYLATSGFQELGLMLPSMLFVQIAVVAVGLASVLRRSKLLADVSLFACSVVMVSMTFIHARMLSITGIFSQGVQIGYWYTCLALTLFIVRFAFSLVRARMATTEALPLSGLIRIHLIR